MTVSRLSDPSIIAWRQKKQRATIRNKGPQRETSRLKTLNLQLRQSSLLPPTVCDSPLPIFYRRPFCSIHVMFTLYYLSFLFKQPPHVTCTGSEDARIKRRKLAGNIMATSTSIFAFHLFTYQPHLFLIYMCRPPYV